MTEWSDRIPLREVPMTPFETPTELLERIRRAAQLVGMELEAAVVPVVTRAYSDGWADGYLARHREIEEAPNTEA